MRRVGRWVAGTLVAVLAVLCWAAVLVPPLLDRIYYDGPVTDHYDGERFFNPDGEDTARPPGGGNRGSFIWRQLTGNDDRPPWPERVPVTPAKPPERVTGDRMLATWVGHATVLVQAGGVNILTDPIWSDVAGPFGVGPRRAAEPGIRFEDLPPIDLVLVSHNHYDHLDLSTLKRLWERDRPKFVTSLGNNTLLRDAGIGGVPSRRCEEGRPLVALDWGQSTDELGCIVPTADYAPRITVTIERNHHWGSRWFTDRNRALWSAFSIRTPAGNIFFGGDTGPGDMRWPIEAAARSGPYRLAIIPIGAFRFEPGVQEGTGSHIGPIEAAEVFARAGASWGLPIHWGTFRLSYEAYDTPPRMLAGVLRCRGWPADLFRGRRIGETWEVPPLRPPPPPPSEQRARSHAACLQQPEIARLP